MTPDPGLTQQRLDTMRLMISENRRFLTDEESIALIDEIERLRGSLAITDELARVASYASCQVCGKSYKDDPGGDCLLADHLEGHAAVMEYRKARGRMGEK